MPRCHGLLDHDNCLPFSLPAKHLQVTWTPTTVATCSAQHACVPNLDNCFACQPAPAGDVDPEYGGSMSREPPGVPEGTEDWNWQDAEPAVPT